MTNAELQKLVDKLYVPGIRWRTFVNPERLDGLFVCEDKEVEPYLNARGEPIMMIWGGKRIPAWQVVPSTPHSLHYQIPHADAVRLVQLLNAKASNVQCSNFLYRLCHLLGHLLRRYRLRPRARQRA